MNELLKNYREKMERHKENGEIVVPCGDEQLVYKRQSTPNSSSSRIKQNPKTKGYVDKDKCTR
jgi:hypothetical protein